MERRITYLVSAVSTTRTLMSVVLIILAILTTNAEASTTSALIPTPAEPHGYTLLASFSTSTITLTTTIPDSGWSYTNAADTWLVVSLDLRYRSSGGAVSTQTVEVPATAFLTISGESVTFRVSTTTLAAHSAYTNVCNQCSPDGGTPGCKCDNIVAYRVVSAHGNSAIVELAKLSTARKSAAVKSVVSNNDHQQLEALIPEIKTNIEKGVASVENNVIFTRSSNPADMYNISTSYTTTSTFAAVPVTTLNNTGDYTALYSCMGAGLVPAAITSSEENTQVQQLSPSRSLLLDIMWSSGFILKWHYDNKNLAWCFSKACFHMYGSYHNLAHFNTGVSLPIVFGNITGSWIGGGHSYEAVLCTDGPTMVASTTTTTTTSSPQEVMKTSSAVPTTYEPFERVPSPTAAMTTTFPMITIGGGPVFAPPPTTTTTTPPTTTTNDTTTTTESYTTPPTTTPSPPETTTVSTASSAPPQPTNPTTTTEQPHTTTTSKVIPMPTTTTSPHESSTSTNDKVGNRYLLHLTLASQVYDMADIQTALCIMFMKSMGGVHLTAAANLPTSQLATAPVVTILELVPGSTVVVAQADNVDESDMDRLRADIESGASELVTVFGAIASSLRIDRIFPSHPGLAAAATVLLLVTMLACVVACVVGCVLYARESIRRTNELREGVMDRKSMYTTERNRASKAFSITAGQLIHDGRPIKYKLKASSTMIAGENASQHDLVSGPLDGGRLTTNQLRVDSANMIWSKEVVEEDFPTPRALRTVQWTEEDPTEI